jgi:hypothetical protein
VEDHQRRDCPGAASAPPLQKAILLQLTLALLEGKRNVSQL